MKYLEAIKLKQKKTVTLNKKTAFATLSILESRPDIQEFLKDFQAGEITIKPPYDRIINYLRSLNLLSREKDLTTDGERVLNKGELLCGERGFYELVYDNEEKVILQVKRLKDKERTELQEDTSFKNFRNIKESLSCLFIEEKMEEEKVWKLTQVYNPMQLPTLSSQRTREIDYKNISLKYDNPKLTLESKNPKSKDFVEEVRKVCDSFGDGKFDTEKHVHKVNFGKLNESEKNQYTRNNEHIEGLMLRPIDQQNANEWHKYILETKIKTYILEEKFEKFSQDILDEKVFEYIKAQPMPMDEYTQENKKSEVYWYLNAPKDLLNFTKDQELPNIIHLKENSPKDMSVLVKSLNPPSNKSIKESYYCDRYVFSSIPNRETFMELKNLLAPNASWKIITPEKNSEHCPSDITPIYDIFKKHGKSDLHDRFLIIKYTDNTDLIWKMTQGNFIKNNQYTNCSFIPITSNDLPKALKDYIETKGQ